MTTGTGGNRKYLYLTVCTGNLLALISGVGMAWTSPSLPKLLDEKYLPENPFGQVISKEEASWIGALLPIGGIFGTFAAGFTSAKIGRKKSVLICCIIPATVSFLMLAFAEELFLYFIARFLAGVVVSSAYSVVPLYNGEIAEISIRGRICSSITTFETTGELFSYCLGPYVTIFWFAIASLCLTLTCGLLIIIILPESPYFFFSKNNKEAAEKSLMRLRSNTSDGVKTELEFIENIVRESNANRGTLRDIIRSKALRKAMITTLFLVVFQHLSGIIPILFYSQLIFDETGSIIPPQICAMIIGFVQFSSSLVTPNLVDRLGRRWMLFISASGMGIAIVHLGLYFFMKNEKGRDVTEFYWLPVTCLVAYIIFYILGYGPLPWTIMGEIFPSNMKSVASTVTVCACWTAAFVMSKSFISVSEAIGIAASFWIFAVNCGISAIFMWTYLIETKGKNFEEIQDLLNK